MRYFLISVCFVIVFLLLISLGTEYKKNRKMMQRDRGYILTLRDCLDKNKNDYLNKPNEIRNFCEEIARTEYLKRKK